MKKNFIHKIIAHAVVVFFVLVLSLKIGAMETPDNSEQLNKEDFFADLDLSDESGGLHEKLIMPIHQALEFSQSGTVQQLIRQALKRLESGRALTTWLKEEAFKKGDPVLLYELARCSLTTGFIDEDVVEQGLFALLLLLIRIEQDVESLKIFSEYVDTRLLSAMYEKAKLWINGAQIDSGVAIKLQFKNVFQKVQEWFEEHSEYSNPAAIEYWNVTWSSFFGKPGICFIDATVERRDASLQGSVAASIANIRGCVKTQCFNSMAHFSRWSQLFEYTNK